MSLTADVLLAALGGSLPEDDVRFAAQCAELRTAPPFDRSAFDALLWRAGFDATTAAQLIRAGQHEAPPCRSDVPLREWALAGFRAGASIALEDLHTQVPAIATLVAALEARLDAEVVAMALLTPAGQSAFDLHRDAVDALVLQLEGRKRWHLHPRIADAPAGVEEVRAERLHAPLQQLDLGPGDLLYVPAGVLHRASALDGPSLQVTLAIQRYRQLDLLRDIVDVLAFEQVALRSRVGGALAAGDAVTMALAADLDAGLPSALRRARELHRWRRVLGGTIQPGGGLARDSQPSAPGARFAPPPGARYHVHEIAGRAALEYVGTRRASIRGPSWLAPVFRFVATRTEPFTLQDMPALLDLPDRQALVRRLIAEEALELLP